MEREITGSIVEKDMAELSDLNVGQAVQKLQGQIFEFVLALLGKRVFLEIFCEVQSKWNR